MNENKPRRRAQAQAAQKATRKSGLSRFVLMVTMMALVAVVSIGGTMAWLQDNTEEVVNTFTVGDINIILQESEYDPDTNELNTSAPAQENKIDTYKIIPGRDLPKDPTVTVKADSEPCWLFVKITEENWTLEDVTYSVDNGIWAPLDGYDNVYYKQLTEMTETDTEYAILTNNTVYVSDQLTKDDLEAFFGDDETKQPKLSFQAFAIQSNSLKDADGNVVSTAAAAWELVKPSNP